MAWMVAEAIVAITAGVIASSIALTGFGLDSVIEFFAAAIVVWQLRGEDRETPAVRLIGVTFFVLAAYLTAQSIHDLVAHARPGESVPGLAISAAALVVMPLLAIAKRRTGKALGNRTPPCRFCRDRLLCLHLSRHPRRRRPEHRARLVVGRPRRSPRYRRTRGQRRHRSLARRRLTFGTHRAHVPTRPSGPPEFSTHPRAGHSHPISKANSGGRGRVTGQTQNVPICGGADGGRGWPGSAPDRRDRAR